MNITIEVIISIVTIIVLIGTGVILYLTYRTIKKYTEQIEFTNVITIENMSTNHLIFRYGLIQRDIQFGFNNMTTDGMSKHDEKKLISIMNGNIERAWSIEKQLYNKEVLLNKMISEYRKK